ncbi:MAG: hypothetical protein M9913_18535 [Bryobacteraceae bacterium]|nr:hypothetical protein [Bryobacteraceae bacterium]
MSAPKSLSHLSLKNFADHFRSEMVPLGNRFCYFAAAVSLSSDDLREYLDEPVAAIPPSIAALLPRIQIILVPYLAQVPLPPRSRRAPEFLIATEPPADELAGRFFSIMQGKEAVLAFAVKDAEIADYHYRFYRALAELVAGHPSGVPQGYLDILHEELDSRAHGEVDEPAWVLKQDLDDSRRRFQLYARQSFIDTLTLYLHGVCCDIDVETGPRQLPSHLLRKRLRFLKQLYPPPSGYAVLPEDLR